VVFIATPTPFFGGGFTGKKLGAGFIQNKNKKNTYKICLYPFLLRFYESGKHFGLGWG
jgi:hypothetical protein